MTGRAHQVMLLCWGQWLFHGVPKKQPIVTLSTTEVEFIVATSCACQAIWSSKNILEILNFKHEDSTTIYCYNSYAIKLCKNLVLRGRSKHIDVKYHYLRDVANGVINLIHCRSEYQIADAFTKPLKLLVFKDLRGQLGVCTLENTS